MRAEGVRFEARFTEAPGHAVDLAREAAQQGYARVICAGGDGTLNEVVNGLMQVEAERRPTLGLIPSGTGTDFARGLGWPKTLDGCIEAIKRGVERRIDVGMVSFSRAGQALARYFINVAGAGFDGDVSDRVNREGKRGGSLAYFLTVFRVLAGYEHKHARVTLTVPEGSERVLEGHYNLIAVGNGRYFGGGMRINPNGDVGDGCLEAIVIEAMSRAEFALNFPKVYRGAHLTHPKVHEYRVIAVRVELRGDGQRMFVEAEGELFGEAPASFHVVPGALRLVVPPGLLQSQR
ncbi:MAG: diacylglycerol kinase [Candidatus Roseilinea sp.]|nr:MAG: diacylglycerol kinase [Candidatus Roseilinea sp.]